MKIINKEILEKYVLNYLNRYASSKKNLKFVLLRKLKKLGDSNYNSKLDVDRIINNLEKKNIINDENFSNSIAFNYARIGKSKKFIKYNLMKKGINLEDIESVLKKLELEMPDFEIKSAINFAKKKKLGKFSESTNKEKDFSKMVRAGFTYDIIKKTLT